jgi:hypothetical protein
MDNTQWSLVTSARSRRLSINDRAETRALFGRFEAVTVETQYAVNPRATRRVRELIVMGGGAD